MAVRKYIKIFGLIAVCSSELMLCNPADSQEISPFRLTGVDGEVYVKYFNDVFREQSNGEEYSRRESKTFEQGIDLNLHSYIYHPNFFRLDFGGGPVYIRNIYDSNLVHNSNKQVAVDYYAKAHILEKKDYPLFLYYDRHTYTSPYSVQDRMVLTREHYGLNLQLKRPLLPFLAVFDLSRSNVDGETEDSDTFKLVTDDTTDKASVKLSSQLGSKGDGSIRYSQTRTVSGNSYVPVDFEGELDSTTKKVIKQLDAKTDHQFGIDEWIRLTNTIYYRNQDNLPQLEEFRYTPRVNLRHSKNFKSSYRYSYINRTVENLDTTVHEADVGLSHTGLSDRLDSDLDLHADRYETEGIEQTFYQADAKVSYLQPYDRFNLRYTGGLGYDYTDRTTDTSSVPVRGETHTVEERFDSFDLNHSNVIESSIVVSNSEGNVCTEGTHYDLVQISDVTRIVWQAELDDPECPLLPDHQVFVNYSYEGGGTASYSGLRQFYGIDLTQGRLLRLFGRYLRVDRNLESGDPTIPLNSKETMTVGANVDYVFPNYWTLGGRTEYEYHDADVGSYRRTSGGIYLDMPKMKIGGVRVFLDRLLVDNLESTEDVDLWRYGARYQSRMWFRTRLSADLVDERDTGGRLDRYTRQAKIRLKWAYRKLSLSAEARYRLSELGDNESNRSSINLLLSRRF